MPYLWFFISVSELQLPLHCNSFIINELLIFEQDNMLINYVKRKTVFALHRIYCKAWILQWIHAMISINLHVVIGTKIIQGKFIQRFIGSNEISSKFRFFALLISHFITCRPDSSNSFDWFSERQTKVLRYIRRFLQSNGTDNEPRAVNQTRIMYQACMDTGMILSFSFIILLLLLSILHLNIYFR